MYRIPHHQFTVLYLFRISSISFDINHVFIPYHTVCHNISFLMRLIRLLPCTEIGVESHIIIYPRRYFNVISTLAIIKSKSLFEHKHLRTRSELKEISKTLREHRRNRIEKLSGIDSASKPERFGNFYPRRPLICVEGYLNGVSFFTTRNFSEFSRKLFLRISIIGI